MPPDPLVPEEDRKKVDAYTLAIRNSAPVGKGESWYKRHVTQPLEAANRKLWARLFDRILYNSTEFERIPIAQLESLFVIPCGEAIGDMIVTLPIFRAIKRRNPNCRTGIFISHRNETLLRCDPDIDDRYRFRDRFDIPHYPELFRARKIKYQVVVNLHFVRLTEFGLIGNVLSPKALKVSTRIGKVGRHDALFNKLGPFDRYSMHGSQIGLMLLDQVVDCGTPLLQSESRPTLAVCSDTQTRVRTEIDKLLKRLNAKWFIYFNPQARMPIREWGVEKTAAFSKRFAERYPDGAIIFTSSPVRHHEVEREINSGAFERSVFLPTSYDVLEVAAIAEASRLVITPDTSVIHFGVAANRPTIVLWLSKNDLPMDWIPLQVPSRNLAPPIVGDPVSTISVDDVWNATVDLLEHRDRPSHTSYLHDDEPLDLYQAGDEPLRSLVERSLVIEEDGMYRRPTQRSARS